MKKELIKNLIILWDEYVISFSVINEDLIEGTKISGTELSPIQPNFENFITWLRNK